LKKKTSSFRYGKKPVIMKLDGLYAITDVSLTPYDCIDKCVSEAIDGGAKIIQLRDKSTSDEELYLIAKKLKKICKQKKAKFLLNDRVVLAKAINADGVHIGKDDTSFETARAILGTKKIIGVSCYDELSIAKEAVKKGADYVAFGAFFPSPTKPNAKTVNIRILKEAKKLGVPVCAIGGVNDENGAQLVKNGADMLAVVSALWKGGIKHSALRINKAFG
jgi:thiamine-phosphate pyrophosphorylase